MSITSGFAYFYLKDRFSEWDRNRKKERKGKGERERKRKREKNQRESSLIHWCQ